MYEAQKKHGTGTDQELIDVLTAISVVSKRLAMKLALIQSQSTEGGKQDEQNERNGSDHQRVTGYCIFY
mgnify:FL=1